jgi:tRNA A-37 threonylcarbamoyl transferase component Bud32
VAHAAGEHFGSYLIEGAIGASQMSDVYVAVDERDGRKVALKIMSEALSESPRFRERFRREAAAASSIDHPNILPIYETGAIDGAMYLAMRLVSGVDLRDVLLERSCITKEETVRVLRQAAAGLDAAHAAGIVHRDVKPDNFLIEHYGTPEEHLFVCDFGIAFREVDARLTIVGEAFGTLGYTAPEQMRSEVVGPAADVFSLGCVAFECLSGTVPSFVDGVATPLRDRASTHPQLAALSPEIDAFFVRCLANDPDQRFRTCTEAVDALEAALDSSGEPVPEGPAGADDPQASAAETRRIMLSAAPTLAEEWAVARNPGDAQATVVVGAGQLPPVTEVAPTSAASPSPSPATTSARTGRWVLGAVAVVAVVVLVAAAVMWRSSAPDVVAGAPPTTLAAAPSTTPEAPASTTVVPTPPPTTVPKGLVLADRNPVVACKGCGPRGRLVVNGEVLFHAIEFPSIAAGAFKSSTYDIGGAGATRLKGTVGLDDATEAKSGVLVVVVGDGDVLQQHSIEPGRPFALDVDITGVDTLELKVVPPAAFPSGVECCVSVVWGDLTLDFT